MLLTISFFYLWFCSFIYLPFPTLMILRNLYRQRLSSQTSSSDWLISGESSLGISQAIILRDFILLDCQDFHGHWCPFMWQDSEWKLFFSLWDFSNWDLNFYFSLWDQKIKPLKNLFYMWILSSFVEMIYIIYYVTIIRIPFTEHYYVSAFVSFWWSESICRLNYLYE